MRTRTVIYWLSVPDITDSVNKSRVFGGHFNPKSQIARIEVDRAAIVAEWNSGGRPDIYAKRQQLAYVEYTCSRIVQYTSTAIRRPFNNNSIRMHNYDNACHCIQS